jgi:multiple sugar transport system permease protein
MSRFRFLIILGYLLLGTFPLVWMMLTSIKSRADTISLDLRFIPSTQSVGARFDATTEGWSRLGEPMSRSEPITFLDCLLNTAVVGACSTLAAVALGTMCGYGFSRFRIAGAGDWMFFILSTRFLPPLAVVVPVWLMWTRLGLDDSRLGLIILYTAFNLSLAVWLMKGFIDEIPRAFEEAALVDGYTRLQAFTRIVLPQARTGMAVTAVFCLISAWNEYGFAMVLNSNKTKTVPVYFAGLQGQISGVPWPQVAAGALLFVLPIVLFAVLVRNHLTRGVTFGTVKG